MKSAQELNALAVFTRKLWNEDNYSPIDIFAIVNGWKEKNITVVKYPMSNRISGMCTKEGTDIIIGINSKMSYGRQRFTLAHELYHVLYEPHVTRTVCDMTMGTEKTESEREADQFAGYLLMPYDALYEYATKVSDWTLNTIIDAEQFFQVSHQAMLYRLVSDNLLDSKTMNQYKDIKVSTVAARLGYGNELYLPAKDNKQYFTTGAYIRKVETLFDNELISNGKREELLMDAYRADIVYDFDEEAAELND